MISPSMVIGNHSSKPSPVPIGENSSIRDAIEGERNLQGFLKAYLAIASYYLVQPELEMNYGYCDFFLLPDKMRYSDIEHSYILELKYATRTATNAELEAQAEEGRQQLLRYSKDKVVQKLATGTTLHLLLIQFQVRRKLYHSSVLSHAKPPIS